MSDAGLGQSVFDPLVQREQPRFERGRRFPVGANELTAFPKCHLRVVLADEVAPYDPERPQPRPAPKPSTPGT